MKKLILFLTLILTITLSFGQNRSGKVSTGRTTLDFPINFNASDTIDASETYWVLVTCNQSYEQTQNVSLTLATVSGSPSVTAFLEGKVSTTDNYTPLDTASAWTSSSNNPITLSTATPNKYRYFKVKLVASGATQKTKVTALSFTCTYSNPTAISAVTGVFSGAVTAGGLITANGGLTLGAGDNLAGSSTSNIALNTNKFTVAGASGNTLIAGTLQVTGAQTSTGLVTANGGVTLGTNVDLIGSSSSDIAINTDKFTVAGATGNTVVAGTLAVTGAQANTALVTANGGVVSTLYNFASATAVGGSGDAITMNFSPDLPTLAVGLAITFVAEAANTTAVTLAVDGGTAKAIGEYNGAYSALDANDIRSGQLVTIVYDGTQWVMMSPSGN